MKSIAEAAKAAVNGTEESIWQACRDISIQNGESFPALDVSYRTHQCEKAIRSMSPEERSLYGISNE